MTQEEKSLLLKDVCARLPYGVMLNTPNGNNSLLALVKSKKYNTIIEYDDYRGNENDISEWKGGDVEFVKPYLRPISSMTEEEMDRLFDILHIDKDGKDDDWIKINDVYGIKFFFPTGRWVENVAEAYDYLYSIHIDFRGLILKGLAIAVTKENNPYKNRTMARIIETPQEFTTICPHCLKRIAFEIEDIHSTYERGLEDSDGWMDFDCLWHYIDCPNCKKTISIDNILPEDVHKVLTKKYNMESL